MDKHGYVFSLVLGKAVPSDERFHNDIKFPFQLHVFKCKNLVPVKGSDGWLNDCMGEGGNVEPWEERHPKS